MNDTNENSIQEAGKGLESIVDTDDIRQRARRVALKTPEVFIEQSWSPAERMSKLQPLVLSDRKRYSYWQRSIFEEENLKQMHPLCRELFEKIKTLSDDEALQNLFVERERKIKERDTLRTSQNEAKKAYDTHLLEAIAAKGDGAEKTRPSIAELSRKYTARIERLTGAISTVEKQINAHPGVQEIWRMVSPENQNRQQVVDDFRRYERWYPLKELGWQLLFLLPIFCIFYGWSTLSLKKERRIQTLIASHLLVVAFIPILVKVIELVVELIPEHFFRALFELLRSLHLIALWHYLVIIGSVALGLFLVFLVQKKVFSRERVIQKRLMSGACHACGKKLPANALVCPFCGTGQMENCSGCQQQTPVGGTYCIRCGERTRNI